MHNHHTAFVVLLSIGFVWEFIWKAFALWRAARLRQPAWFVCLFVLNTAGVLEIVYLLTHRAKDELEASEEHPLGQ